MSTQDIMNSLLKENWYVQDFIGCPLHPITVCRTSFRIKKDIGFSYKHILFTHKKNNLMEMYYSKTDFFRMSKIMNKKFQKDKNYFIKVKSLHEKKFNKIFQKFLKVKKNTSKYTEKELFTAIKLIIRSLEEAVGIGHIIEAYSIPKDHVLKDKLSSKIKNIKELNKVISVLTTPSEKAFVNVQQEKLTEIFKIKDKKKKGERIKESSKKI